jgi:hypothetical protein
MLDKGQKNPSLIDKIQKILARNSFAFRRRVARVGFRYRRDRYFRKRHPVLWLTPSQLLEMDLEHYEAETDAHSLSLTTLERLRAYRDAIEEKMKRARQISLLMFAALVSNYFAIDSDLSFAFGIQAKFAGFREVFLVALSFIGVFIAILENNVYTLNSYMKFIIGRLPEEVRQMHIAAHFFSENMSRYIPVNLPRISQTPINSNLSLIPFLFGLFLLLTALLIYGGMYFLIARDIWQNGNLENWSKVSVAVAVTNAVLGIIYVVTTRAPLPYRDSRKLDDIEFMKAVAPSQLDKLLNEMNSDIIADFNRMVEKGYMKADEDLYGKL